MSIFIMFAFFAEKCVFCLFTVLTSQCSIACRLCRCGIPPEGVGPSGMLVSPVGRGGGGVKMPCPQGKEMVIEISAKTHLSRDHVNCSVP